MADRSWAEVQRVLCIRLDALGDVLMTTPAIRAIREGLPGREITLMTSPSGAAVAGMIPEVDRLICYEAPWLKATPPRKDSAGDLAMIAGLKGEGFDAAVIFTVFSQNPLPAALMAYLADIPLRAAYSRENPYQLLTHMLPDPYPSDLGEIPHEVRRHLDLAASLGCITEDERLSLRVPQGAETAVRAKLEQAGIDGNRPWVVLHPGSTAVSRRYPPELFVRAAERMVEDYGLQVVLSGTGSEVELAETMRQSARVRLASLAGRLSLEEFASLLRIANVLVSNNTGPVHIAAALGTPVVDLYAQTNPQHTPWKVPNRVLFQDVPCRWCFKSVCPMGHQNCLRLVPPEKVAAAAAELLEERGQNG